MTTNSKSKSAIVELKAILEDDEGRLRTLFQELLQELLEQEMTRTLAAAPSERIPDRSGYRAGHHPRSLVTRVGKLELRVPRDREGRFSTELSEHYQRSEQALVEALAQMSAIPANSITDWIRRISWFEPLFPDYAGREPPPGGVPDCLLAT